MSVHAAAVVHEGAKIDPEAEIGPFALIHENVVIGRGCVIGPYAEINHARIGSGTRIGSRSIVGGDPQMQNWTEVSSLVRIGNNNDIRELVTIHRSKDGGGETAIGDRNMIMSNTHIGHDCLIGDDTAITTYAGLSGHVTVQDFAIIGGHAGIHQFVRVGESAMVGGMTRLVQDVAPFMMVEGHPSTLRGTNAVGLKRRGFSPKVRSKIKEAYKVLFRLGLSLENAEKRLGEIEDGGGEIKKIMNFIASTKRGLTGILNAKK
ncbi:MAG: acyl-[acyl-carrier-protein]--UDP-N-acetylglucosamine O-acyltransferase [bacterium]|nr:MAG: acyl-[acyl-carrier-protein]--UDP-N-acetylglucosamine O-acyltransferase [bacterium]